MNRFFDIDSFQEIIESLKRNKSRSLLTGFGVFWGIFMLLFLMGGGDGVQKMLTKTFDGVASNSGFILPYRTSVPYKGFASGRPLSLNDSDVAALRENLPEIQTICGVISIQAKSAEYGNLKSDCSARGVSPEYNYIETATMKYGRFINKLDMEQERRVCVIGKRIYHDLFPQGGNPCGSFIKLGGIFFEVIGVDVHDAMISINGTAETSVTIPMAVAQKIFGRGNRVDFLAMVAHPGVKIKDLLSKCNELLSRRLIYNSEDKKAIIAINTQEIFGIIDNLFKGLDLLIWLVGFGTLLAAAIGVSNIMMVTVKERTVEIGIRRAIGATPKMILTQIMSESMLLTFVSGLVGIVFSVAVLALTESLVARTETPVPFQISFGSALLVVLILMALGLLAGLAPAMRAMEIKPVDAMRDE